MAAQLSPEITQDAEKWWFQEIRELAFKNPLQASARSLCFDGALNLFKNIADKYYIPKYGNQNQLLLAPETQPETEILGGENVQNNIILAAPIRPHWVNTIDFPISRCKIPSENNVLKWPAEISKLLPKSSIVFIVPHLNWNSDETLAVFHVLKKSFIDVKAIIPSDRWNADVLKVLFDFKGIEAFICSNQNDIIKVLQESLSEVIENEPPAPINLDEVSYSSMPASLNTKSKAKELPSTSKSNYQLIFESSDSSSASSFEDVGEEFVTEKVAEKTKLVTKLLKFPRIVCASEKCIEIKRRPFSEQIQTVYKTICHDPCDCVKEDGGPGIVPDPRLQKCKAMNGKPQCKNCGCSWTCHMRITHEQFYETQKEEK